MDKIIISDTSCLIALTNIDKLDILRDLYRDVIITKDVYDEFGGTLPDWIMISEVKSRKKQAELESRLDKGEASSIALALEIQNSTLIIDEVKGRKIAQSLNIDIIGTIGVLLLADKQGLIKYNSKETIVYNSENSIIPDTAVIWDIAVDNKNNVWIGCEGLIKYDGNSFTYYNSSNSPMPENNVMSITIDSKDNIWFSSCVHGNGGLVKFDGKSWIIFTPDNSELPTNIINDIAVDKDDNIWVTTHSQTLSKISNNSLTTYTFNSLNGAYYSLGNIAINKKNDICVVINNGAFSGGIWACESCSKILIFNELKREELYNNNILLNIKSMFIDSDNNIWCIDYNYFTIYNGNNWITDNTSLEEDSLFVIVQALDDKIWIGTGDGIYINH